MSQDSKKAAAPPPPPPKAPPPRLLKEMCNSKDKKAELGAAQFREKPTLGVEKTHEKNKK